MRHETHNSNMRTRSDQSAGGAGLAIGVLSRLRFVSIRVHAQFHSLRLLCLIAAMLFVFTALYYGNAQVAQPASRYYYAIENLDNGQTIRRGKTTVAGIPQGDLILAPDTNYREWLYNADTKFVGFTYFR